MSSRYDQSSLRRFVTSEEILAPSLRGDTTLVVRDNSTVTDEARELAMKLGMYLEDSSQIRATAASAQVSVTPERAAGSSKVPLSDMRTLPEDTARRVADAIAAVLSELKLSGCASSIAPVITRRVFAGLAKAAEKGSLR